MGKRLVGLDMNLHIRMVVSLLALILIQGCTGRDDTPTSQQEGEITQEEGLIVTTLKEVATRSHNFTVRRTPYPFSGSTRKIMQKSKMGNQKR